MPPASGDRTLGPSDEPKLRQHPIGTPRGLSPSSGVLAVGAWLAERGIVPPQSRSWRIDIALDPMTHTPQRVFAESIDTRFAITILPDEWAYCFCHAGRISRVRIADMPRVDGRDDHQLALATPPLKRIGALVRSVEQRCGVFLQRHQATIETTLAGSEPIIRAWLTTF